MCHPLLCLCLCDCNMDSFSTNTYVYFKSLLRKLYFKSFLRKLSFKYLSIQLLSILLFLSADWWQNLRLFLFSASLFSTVIMTKKFRFLNWNFFLQTSFSSAIVTKKFRFLGWTFKFFQISSLFQRNSDFKIENFPNLLSLLNCGYPRPGAQTNRFWQ